jgi:segregation and condensation protein B
MEYFGINDLNELPVPKEFTSETETTSTIGENTDLKETDVQPQQE